MKSLQIPLADFAKVLLRASDWHRINHGHDDRTSALALAIGERLNGAYHLTENDLVCLQYGALLHDVGRIGIDSELMLKPQFTAADRAAMESHVHFGYDLVADILPKPIAETILYHHEHWDGTGYPQGLVGEAIPLFARIVRIADHWDALRNERPYRGALTVQNALHIMKLDSRFFDPQLYAVFMTVIRGGGW